MINALRAATLALLLLAVALGLWHAALAASQIKAGLAYRGPLDGQEGTLLYEASLVLRGEPLYQPLRLDRVIGAPYPPLHTYALAAVERQTPLQAADQRHVFAPGRRISTLGILGAALLLGLAVWRLGGNPIVGLLAPLLFVATPPTQLWATRIKPDPLALLFTAGGVLCVGLALKREETTGNSLATPASIRHQASGFRHQAALLVGAAALFALAYFTKQTQVAAPVAVALTLLLAPPVNKPLRGVRALFASRRALLLFLGAYGGMVAAGWLALDLASNGQFTHHVWGLHPPGWWSAGRFGRYAALLLPSWPLGLLCLSGLVGLLSGRLRGRTLDARLLLALTYAALGTATLVGAGTTGSHHNHLLEPALALTLGGCASAAWLLKRSAGGTPRAPIVGAWARFALQLGVALLLVGQGWSYLERPAWYGGEFDLARDDWQRFVTLARSQPGEVLADDVGLLLLAGKEPRYDDPATMGPAASSGLWDQRGLLNEIAAQRFDLVLLPFDASEQDSDPAGRWTPEFIAALRQHYRLLYRDVLFSYVPAER